MATVILMLKDTVISEVPLVEGITSIGRSPNSTIFIDNLAVSSCHAKITNRSNSYIIEDLNSTNGTFVNDKRVSSALLADNDVILIGKHSLIISCPPETDDQDATQFAHQECDDKTVVMNVKQLRINTPTQKADIITVPLLGGFSVIDGPVELREYMLNASITTIGKSVASIIRLKGFFAPREAALVHRNAEGYSLSRSSRWCRVKVNGIPVTGQVVLAHNDIVDVWKVKMKFFIKN
jgi:hypothetical protein